MQASVSSVVIDQWSQKGQWSPSNSGCCDRCCKILFVSEGTERNCVGYILNFGILVLLLYEIRHAVLLLSVIRREFVCHSMVQLTDW